MTSERVFSVKLHAVRLNFTGAGISSNKI